MTIPRLLTERDIQISDEPLDPSELDEALSTDKEDRSAEEWDLIELAAEKWLSSHDGDLERVAADLWRADNPSQSVFDCDGEMKAHYRRLALERSTGDVRAQAERPPSMRDNFSDGEIAAAFRDQTSYGIVDPVSHIRDMRSTKVTTQAKAK